MNTFLLEDARAADRAELLEFLHSAFKTNDANHPRFEAIYPDFFFTATEETMARHRVIRHEGRICACVGWYPMRVRVGENNVDVFGIGQVSCDPALRGGGRMTALLDDVCAKMDASGAGLSWLGGRRDRYAHFGWDLAGANLMSGMDARSVAKPEPGWRVEQTDPAQLARFWPLRNRAAISEDVPPETWLARMMRGGKLHRVFLASRGKDAGAFCVAQAAGGGDSLMEWAGETAGIHAIVSHLLASGQKGVNVAYSPALDPAAQFFWNSAGWSSAPMSNLRVLNLGALFKGYAPWLAEHLPPGVGVNLSIRDGGSAQLGNGGPTLELDRLTMARFLFGPSKPSVVAALPSELRWLDQVFPLPFLLPPLSSV